MYEDGIDRPERNTIFDFPMSINNSFSVRMLDIQLSIYIYISRLYLSISLFLSFGTLDDYSLRHKSPLFELLLEYSIESTENNGWKPVGFSQWEGRRKKRGEGKITQSREIKWLIEFVWRYVQKNLTSLHLFSLKRNRRIWKLSLSRNWNWISPLQKFPRLVYKWG